MVSMQIGEECGMAGTPCCLQPDAGTPRNLIRPMCAAGLSCMVTDPMISLPYGSTKHIQAVLKYPGSEGLLAANVMGTCDALPQAEPPAADSSAPTNWHGANSVLGECGQFLCPSGTYCASNEEHLLGGPRCMPVPACGGLYQSCCPPYSNRKPAVPSIVDKQTAVPTCNDPNAVCVWKSSLDTFDPSSNNQAVPLLTPPGSTSNSLQYPNTLCLPDLSRCGQEGQPCCPHAQFARSNSHMYFRLHVCDPGLRYEAPYMGHARRGSLLVRKICL